MSVVGQESEALDPSVLKKLRSLERQGGRDILGTLVALFVEHAQRMLRDLEYAVESGDDESLHRTSHTLSSASANIGALLLASRCRELSQQARSGSVVNSARRVSVIAAEYRRAEAALLAYAAQGLTWRKSK